MRQNGEPLKVLTHEYSNIKLISPDGVLMCRISHKRAKWYLDRNLAKVIDGDAKAIQLNFQPNGLGNHDDPFYTTERRNICVVCGSGLSLTKHHCVPYCFRRYFPFEYKAHLSHDILMICISCHEKYEQYAQDRKIQMVQLEGPTEDNRRMFVARKICRTLHKYSSTIPAERVRTLYNEVEEAIGQTITPSLIEELAQSEIDLYQWQRYVEKIDDIHAFIREWRKHFVDFMKPKYLPKHWDIEGRYTSTKS